MGGSPPIRARFFATPSELRAWLAAHHRREDELWVGVHRKGTGVPSVTWPELVDEVLCFGWIDGVRKTLDATRWAIRITPRRAVSRWSEINVERVAALRRAGRLRPAGLAAFARRAEDRTGTHGNEQRRLARLDAAQEELFRAHERAWAWFEARPPGYRRNTILWVTSARREETRARRLRQLIEHSAAGRTIPPLTR